MKKNKNHKKKYMCLITSFFVLLTVQTAFGQVQNAHVNLEDYISGELSVTISLKEIGEPYFFYENELVEIKVKMRSILNLIESHLIDMNASLGKKMKNYINSSNLNIYRLSDFKTDEEKLVMEILMTDCVDSGYCTIKDKTHNKMIDVIVIKFYEYEPAPLKGEHGKFFAFQSGQIFYKTKGDLKEIYDPINIEGSIYKTIEISLNQREIEEPYFYYENSLAEIKVSMDDLHKLMSECVSCEKIDRVIKNSNLNEYRLDNFEDTGNQRYIKGILSILIMEGNCIIKEKGKNDIIKKITVDYYDYHCGLLCGERGTLFRFLSGDIFYQNIDTSY